MAQARSSVIEDIRNAARLDHLDVFGVMVENGETVILLGPHEPGFWAHVSQSAELTDGLPDPLDRWSKRIIGKLAESFEADTAFPSDGPPYPPFISWALESAQAWLAPIGMLVHERAGLMTSYRGALKIKGEHALSTRSASPCTPCDKPCKTACPVDALSDTSYDVDACKTHVLGPDTKSCRTLGCAARRACPISHSYGRLPEQSAFHMRAFLGK